MAPVVGSQEELVEARRHHLAALAYELEARSLACRMLGAGESVLRAASPVTGRNVMILATASAAGWSYLWSGGGMADAAAPAIAADQIARLLGQPT
ncbi:MAG: hypothetical protein QOE54_3511 [Streptosporangiaceae bacterium]|jgi:hypothetical protein|nr:hypothetical protein [Streptosporangiaceae bacterium]MDX6431145.1 hypothetical protein [Streptosporangiaceae bacterium]